MLIIYTDFDMNLIGLNWIDELDLFTVLLNFFNKFQIFSVYVGKISPEC